MKPEEIRALARATCCWLAYKHVTGFEDVLGEAMLSIPISEYLKTCTNWALESEIQYRKICGSTNLPDLSCDFVGKASSGESYRFILETKFLKENAHNRARHIAADLVRLSMPSNENLKRYFLIAGHSRYFPEADADFLFGRDLFSLERGKGRYIRPKDEIKKPDFIKLFSQYQALPSDCISDYAYVQYGANEKVAIDDSNHFQVLVWSVGRSERAAKAGISES